MESVHVTLGERSYRILIQHRLIDEAGETIFSCANGKHAVIITNTTVGPLYLPAVKKSLEDALFQVDSIEVPDGEEYKTLSCLEQIYDRLLSCEPFRAFTDGSGSRAPSRRWREQSLDSLCANRH